MTTFWITLLAWLCCSAVWWLVTAVGSWWIALVAPVLLCASFTPAIIKDIRTLIRESE